MAVSEMATRYLTELQRHVPEVPTNPAEWMRWGYRETLQRARVGRIQHGRKE